MKKNFLFKGVAMLGAISLLANVMLPSMEVFATSEMLLKASDFGTDGKYSVDLGSTSIQVKDQSDFDKVFELKYNEGTENYDDTWTIVDHTNFNDAFKNQLSGYYMAYPEQAAGDGETWPPYNANNFPWLVVNHNFDGKTTLRVTYNSGGNMEVFEWKPSNLFAGTSVSRDAAIIGVSNSQDLKLGDFYYGNGSENHGELIGEAFDKSNIVKVEMIHDGISKSEYDNLLTLRTVKFANSSEAVNLTFSRDVNGKVILEEPTNQPTKEGFTFSKWTNSGEVYTFGSPITEDVTLVAEWNQNPAPSSSSSSGGGGGSKKSTTKTDDAKATTGDTVKVDEQKVDETKPEEEKANEENKVEEKAPMTDAEAVSKFGQEQIDAYKWALENGITTMKTVEEARLDYPLTRAELAKMMVVYIAKILGKQPVLTGNVGYQDVDANKLGDLAGYIQLAYQYQIMGIDANGDPIEFFNPNGLVTRGEYATVFSRVLFGALFNKEGEDFYTDHIEALNKAGILSDTNPTQREMRGWVMLMMYRSTQNADKIASVIEALGATEQEATDAQSKAEEEGVNEENAENAEATTGDVVEAPEAETTTGDVAEAPEAEANTGAVAE